MTYPTIQPGIIVKMKQLNTGVILPQGIAGAGSWIEQQKDFLHNGDSSNDISVIVDFIVIAVESRIGLFLF
jgi:hypothetical protein